MAKAKNEMNKRVKGQYIKLPNKIFDMKLDVNALAIYILFLKDSENFNPSNGYIQGTLGISKPTVIKYKKLLESRNMIRKIVKGGLGRISKYELVMPKDWK